VAVRNFVAYSLRRLRRDRLGESIQALDLVLTPHDIAELDAAIPPGSVAGTRYGEDQMRWLDSEQPV
jgi:hypothetical protein